MAFTASSSNPLVLQLNTWDAFISFRGKDIRYGLLSHLAKVFKEKKINAFTDDKLRKGEDISQALLEIIEKSSVSVVIFSKNYADSPWCLDELVKILECREKLEQIVLPVFYLVDPTDVQELAGRFGKAFRKLKEKRQDQHKVDGWSQALNKASNLSGWDSRNIKSESELVDAIVNGVLGFTEYAQEGQVLAELKKWEKDLMKIYTMLDNAEEKQWVNPLVEMWVSDLRDLAYDVEDVLDELATEARRRKLQVEPQARASKIRRISSDVSASMNVSTFKFNAQMISKIEGISARLAEIFREKDDLNSGEFFRERRSQVRARLPSTCVMGKDTIYGREKDKGQVLERLKAEASDVNVSVIPIVGMGGIGKTTLAQLIYNDNTLDFDFKAWVSVGVGFDVLRLTKTILQPEYCDHMDLNTVQLKLKEKLSMKKFLVVLDDVWTEDYEDWTLFSCPFEAGASGSKVIITTGNESMSLMMGTTQTYSLQQLSHDDCLSVFAQHALVAMDFDERLDLKEIGKEIVKRCQGLPLAAKALGGMLRGSLNLKEWEEVLNSNIWDLPNQNTTILPALTLSYLHLPSHLKRCFVYCAIFPKDYEFDKTELIVLWMAEGFLYQPTKPKPKPMQDLGCQYFDDLLSRSFFQQSTSNESRYVMHHLVNDLARYAGKEICFLLDDKFGDENSGAKIRHLSFIRQEYEIWQKFEGFSSTKGLRTFLSMPIMSYPSVNHLSSKVLHDLLPKLKCLRVLSVAGYDNIFELPSSIGALKHLRYLNLSATKIKRLPESVGALLNLQTLLLCDCWELEELFSGIGNLINLQCLDISGAYKLKEMPLQISNLRNLHTLTNFMVGRENGLRCVEGIFSSARESSNFRALECDEYSRCRFCQAKGEAGPRRTTLGMG